MKKDSRLTNDNIYDETIKCGASIIFEGISKEGDDWIVAKWNSNLCMVLRNQGDHDRRFFIVAAKDEAKAVELAKRHCIA